MVKESMLAIQKLADVKAIAQGGYPEVNIKVLLLSFLFFKLGLGFMNLRPLADTTLLSS